MKQKPRTIIIPLSSPSHSSFNSFDALSVLISNKPKKALSHVLLLDKIKFVDFSKKVIHYAHPAYARKDQPLEIAKAVKLNKPEEITQRTTHHTYTCDRHISLDELERLKPSQALAKRCEENFKFY